MLFNFLWGLFFIAVNFGLWLASYKFFGKKGLYAWVGFATVIANIQVTKTIGMFGLVMTLGNTIYTSIYMCTDLLNEKYGARDARKAVWFGFFSLVASTIMMQMALVFNPYVGVDFAQGPMESIFGMMPRLAAASLTAYFVSQFLDVRVYSQLKARFANYNQLWIRTNGSTVFSQMIDSLIFCTIAFAGVEGYTLKAWLEILLTTYLFKFIISVASTPVMYWARSLTPKEDSEA